MVAEYGCSGQGAREISRLFFCVQKTIYAENIFDYFDFIVVKIISK